MLSPYVERLMARAVEARVLDGELADLAAQEVCDDYELEGPDRAYFLDQYALHSVRADRLEEMSVSRVATLPRRADPCVPDLDAA